MKNFNCFISIVFLLGVGHLTGFAQNDTFHSVDGNGWIKPHQGGGYLLLVEAGEGWISDGSGWLAETGTGWLNSDGNGWSSPHNGEGYLLATGGSGWRYPHNGNGFLA